MRTPAWKRLAARTVLVTFTTCFVACGGSPGEAPSTTTVPAPPPTLAPATLPPPPPPPPPTTPTLPAQPPQQLGKQELRELVAPVALYPDVVLASLLPATTNADQVHDAAQYVGSAAHVDRVPDDRGWDGSVIGLLQFPDVLRWLDANPAWTDEMGQAVTYQQGDVLQAVQDYRRAALDVGNLKTNQYQKVRSEPDRDITIEPARPDVVYVPSYDPVQATQPQPAQASPGINPWIAFGGGAVVGALGAWALYSIFDNDDNNHKTVVNNYYGGGRKIQGYDNYYYAGRRRPRPVDWTPRARQYRQHPQGWQQTQQLQHAATSTRPGKSSAALHPPMTSPAGQAQRPGQVKREQQMERREQQQQQQVQHKQQRQDQKQQQHEQRQERKQEQHQKQQAQQQQQEGRRQEQRQQQQKKREMQQEQQRQNQQQRQERKQEQHQQQQQQREQRQEQKQQKQSERGNGDGQKPNKKKKQQQNQNQ